VQNPTIESREPSFNESIDMSNSALMTQDLGTIFPAYENYSPNNHDDKYIEKSVASCSSAKESSPSLNISRSRSPKLSSPSLEKKRKSKASMPRLQPHKILTCLPPGYVPPCKRKRKITRIRAHNILTCLPPGF